MKKKGLIISTLVMVVVLIAALTTTTFAWFSQSASATIDEFTLETQASQGLQIATYRATGTGESDVNYNYTSGNITLREEGPDQGKYWAGDVADFGQALTIQGDEATIDGMYGASGDGLKIFMNKKDDQGLDTAGKPENLVEAKANINFFQLDFVLHSTASEAKNIFVKQLNVKPYGSDANKYGMAASARIALFVTSEAPKAQEDSVDNYATYDLSTNGKFLYDPYGEIKYQSGKWIEDKDTGNKYAKSAGTYASAMTGDNLKTDWGAKYITSSITNKNQAPAAEGVGFGGTEGYANLAAAKAGNANFDIGTIQPQQEVYLRLVIWFDGEDSACNQTFAGGGITVEINFSLDVEA